jgi:hypothetical protein
MSHLYWGVKCKTPDCDNDILYIYGGIHVSQTWPLLEGIDRPVTFECKQCKQPHQYEKQDFEPIVSEIPPPAGFPRMAGV